MATQKRNENIRASVLVYLEASTLIETVPVARWATDRGEDLPTGSMADWIEPTVRSITGSSSRDSNEARVLIEIGVAVRPGAGDIHRNAKIEDAAVDVLRNARISVKDYANADPSTEVGVLRVMDPDVINAGKVASIHRSAVQADAVYTPT